MACCWTGRRKRAGFDGCKALLEQPEGRHAAAPSSADFVEDLYLGMFDPAPDAEGLVSWTGALDQGAPTRAEVVARFVAPGEFDMVTIPALATDIANGLLGCGHAAAAVLSW
ncbi:MAG: DUF4214 domain-containing protein [Acetobacteraceae bacterium]|nr:DUF4214 domain-containing protein [Acetobacteraceae bacterium]MDI3307389.1 DUF4214 domain-containing protein [Acetobacteraceae bacterium]MDI3309611.1 DUF4214 domain-containing protein [Acetobacteraceae bacterium]